VPCWLSSAILEIQFLAISAGFLLRIYFTFGLPGSASKNANMDIQTLLFLIHASRANNFRQTAWPVLTLFVPHAKPAFYPPINACAHAQKDNSSIRQHIHARAATTAFCINWSMAPVPVPLKDTLWLLQSVWIVSVALRSNTSLISLFATFAMSIWDFIWPLKEYALAKVAFNL
jgi:hypothetical protein